MTNYYSVFSDSLAKAKATRSARQKQHIPKLSPEEKQRFLEENHPDYRASGYREIHVGPNKGERAPKELADLLESPGRLNGVSLNTSQPHHQVDILIIGAAETPCSR